MTDKTAFQAPLYVAWEITHRCNARCIHCYSNSGPDADTKNDLSLEEALNLIDQLADAGVLILALSGGEPMLHSHWRNLVEHALSRGLGVNIGTNGSSITDRTAAELASLGVKSVTVSLDSNKPRVHDYFRQFPGLFDLAIRAIKRLVENQVRVVVGFTPTTINWKDGPAVIQLAYELGADAVNLSEYVPAGRGTLPLALPKEQLAEVLHDWVSLRKQYAGKIEVIWHDCRVGMLVPPEEQRSYVGCGAGSLVARILPDGTITPCVFLPTSVGNIRAQTFAKIWGQSELLLKLRTREGYVTGECGNCKYLHNCGGCRSNAFAFSGGDIFAEDPSCWIDSAERCQLSELIEGEQLAV